MSKSTVKYEFPFGESSVSVSLPSAQVVNEVCGKKAVPVVDIVEAVRQALQHPIASPPLNELIRAGESVVIIVSDVTRRWVRFDLFLPVLLDELNRYGVADENITLVVALGAHRQQTDEENELVFGREVVKRVAVCQSQAQKEEDFIFLGTTSRGTPVSIHKRVANADKVIVTGGIVYHIMAGFGGGRKAIMPGVSAYHSIQANHRLCLHPDAGGGIHPDAYAGSVEANAMNLDQLEIGELVKPSFLLNAVFTPEGNFARFVAGHWLQAWKEGCQEVVKSFGVPIREKTDLVVASAGGYPKDIKDYDYVVDAIDTVTAKLDLVVQAQALGVPIVSCMGTGNKLDPTKFKVADIYKTSVCPLARVMRKELRVRGVKKLKVVYSEEVPRYLAEEGASCHSHCICPKGTTRKCTARRQIPGSIAFMPSVAGLILAGEVVRDILEIK